MEKRKVTIFNRTPHNIYIDIDGKANTDDIIVLGKTGRVTLELPVKRIEELKRELQGQVIIK